MILKTIFAAALIGLAAPAMADVSVGPLTLTGAFARATMPGAPVAGGFLTIRNTGTTDDRLTGGATDVAREVQVHEMAMEGDVMKMRAPPDGLPIPAGQEVVLKPGSYHLMLMAPSRPLKAGETVDITLTFEKAGAVRVPFEVRAPGGAH